MVSVTRVFKIVMRVAEWATPKVKEWHRERNVNRNEAQRHLQSRNWSEAERYFVLALEEKQHPAVTRLGFLLGLCEAQRCQSKLEAAESTANEAIKIALQERNESMHALALDTLASVQLDQGKLADAEKTAQEVLRLEGKRAKPDHARLASCSNKLATVLDSAGRAPEAIEALKQAATHAEKAFGPIHSETASHLTDLGALQRRHGQHDAAQMCLRRALNIHRTTSGVDSLEATQALYTLAASLEESGDMDGAMAEYEKLLTLRERQIGGDPLDTAEAQVRLAGLHLRVGRIPSGRELLIRAVPVLERKGGARLAEAYEMLACAEDLSGRGKEAQHYRDKALRAAAIHAVDAVS